MRTGSRILDLSYQFRTAIEKAMSCRRFPFRDRMNGFTFGCCDDASDLLACYLKHHGIDTLQVNGVYRDNNPENTQNHVWLNTYDGLLIDITGDQFREKKELLYYEIPVYVGCEDALHKLFVDRKTYPNFEFEVNDSPGAQRMMNIYRIILEYL